MLVEAIYITNVEKVINLNHLAAILFYNSSSQLPDIMNFPRLAAKAVGVEVATEKSFLFIF